MLLRMIQCVVRRAVVVGGGLTSVLGRTAGRSGCVHAARCVSTCAAQMHSTTGPGSDGESGLAGGGVTDSAAHTAHTAHLHAFPASGRHILELLDGFRRSQALFAAVELGLFDMLEDERACAEDVANGLDLSIDGTQRLLEACSGLGLVQKNGAIFENTGVARAHLLANSPNSFVGYIKHSLHVLYPLWSNLRVGVKHGRNVWEETFGASSEEVFANMYKTQSDLERFLDGMHSMGCLSSPQIVKAFDLSHCRRALDVAGGTGHLAIAFCQQYPNASAVVGDLSPVLPVAAKYIVQADLNTRVGVVELDMFAGIPTTPAPPSQRPGGLDEQGTGLSDGGGAASAASPTETASANNNNNNNKNNNNNTNNNNNNTSGGDGDKAERVDLVMLSRILHDWDDERCAQLLSNCFHALPSGGMILLAEMLLRDNKNQGPLMAQLQSLNMLVQTHGKERSCAEYERLLRAAGFVGVQCRRTGVYLDALIATKP